MALLANGAFAQQEQVADSVIQLSEVIVSSSRLESYATGHFAYSIDSTQKQLLINGSVSDVLRKLGIGHFRSYGVGGVTTASFRGSGASHTSVVWNGVTLQSPLNGQTDLSLIPAFLIDDITIQAGGTVSLYGSGAIGGTMSLHSRAKFNEGLSLQSANHVASFGNYFNGIAAGYSNERWCFASKAFHISARNDFEYRNKYAVPSKNETRQHNSFEQWGILQEADVRLNHDQSAGIKFWYQDNHFEVPNSIAVARTSQATQRDQFYRSVATWRLDKSHNHFSYRFNHVAHLLDYRDPYTSTSSLSRFESFNNTLEHVASIGNVIEATSGITNIHESSTAVEIAGKPSRNRTALYTAWMYQLKKLKTTLGIREEIVGNEFTPVAPSLGLEIHAGALTPFLSVTRNYRIPTFNDLYWNDAGAHGNKSLKPELSWSEEAGIRIHRKFWQAQMAAFNSLVDNWILWSPQGNFWTPGNIRQVWSRGLESNASIQLPLGSITSELSLRYSYTRATNRRVYDNSNSELGKQLFFTPQHEGTAMLRTQWRRVAWMLNGTYTGKQYTDGSNNEYFAMKPYVLVNSWLTYGFMHKHYSADFTFECNNLFGQYAEARPGYPLPGRNFRLGINFRFTKPNQK